MTLTNALRTISKRTGLSYVKWGKLAGWDSKGVVWAAVCRNDAMFSSVLKIVGAAGYDIYVVKKRRKPLEEPILIDSAGRSKGGEKTGAVECENVPVIEKKGN